MSSGSRSSKTKPIPLRVANKVAYVWDVDDIATLRSMHRVCGVLTGTLPHLSQQNVFLGVPLVLMPEEVVLLVDTGVAVLINDSTAHLQPTIPQLTKWSREQQNSMRSQLAYAESKTLREGTQSGRALSEEAQRKRKEREERKKAKAREQAIIEAEEAHEADIEDANGKSSGDSDPADSEPNVYMISSTSTVTPAKAAKLRESALKGGGSLSPIPSTSSNSTPSKPSTPTPSFLSSSSQPYTIVVPASSSELEWYSPTHSSAPSFSSFASTATSTYTTLNAARAADVWTYPATLTERARCGVFRGLWEQGYFMGVGIKFGGEYLVYPGDPLRYHSHFTATVIESPVATLRPMEIVAHGRLGTATKKAHLLCGWDDVKKEVSYLSIEWAGFG
ncbi:hypothetical protein CPB83DRAFT_845326 [Crepidotus variabilis]|uniref:tRNA-intron lyase n=1 Tax=Crepidotus variabilis TaxID=179855 RepID=A0A9P6JTT7_9AGAR|nr:hypothetical protein CPB83DRAFT_845326 [Crepidotus variabilis]